MQEQWFSGRQKWVRGKGFEGEAVDVLGAVYEVRTDGPGAEDMGWE